MRRRNSPPQIIGLSFLDLVSCAFGGLIVLYALSDRVSGSPEPYPSGIRILEVTIEQGLPYSVGLHFKLNEETHECWRSNCSSGTGINWTVTPGNTTALIIQSGKISDIVGIALIEGENFLLSLPSERKICVKIFTYERTTTVLLERDKLYRAKANLNQIDNKCPL